MADARYLTDSFAVSPQITIEDLDELQAAGFRTIVCNRPDEEVPAELSAAEVEAACRDRGLVFVLNPLTHGQLTPGHVELQRDAANGEGPVLAYCASGNRSSILWSLAMAGTHSVGDIIERTSAAGYNLHALAPQLEAMAAARG